MYLFHACDETKQTNKTQQRKTRLIKIITNESVMKISVHSPIFFIKKKIIFISKCKTQFCFGEIRILISVDESCWYFKNICTRQSLCISLFIEINKQYLLRKCYTWLNNNLKLFFFCLFLNCYCFSFKITSSCSAWILSCLEDMIRDIHKPVKFKNIIRTVSPKRR